MTNKYNLVRLKEANSDIEKGTYGIIQSRVGSDCIVLFFNPKNYGDYACVTVNERHLLHVTDLPHLQVKELIKFSEKTDLTKKTKFTESQIKEYDFVQIIVDKEKYIKHGVYKGMVGTVMQNHAIKNNWEVCFEGKATFNGIAKANDIWLSVYEEDIKLIDKK